MRKIQYYLIIQVIAFIGYGEIDFSQCPRDTVKEAFERTGKRYEEYHDFFSHMEGSCYVLAEQGDEGYTDEFCELIGKERVYLEQLYMALNEKIGEYEKYLEKPKDGYMKMEYLKKHWGKK